MQIVAKAIANAQGSKNTLLVGVLNMIASAIEQTVKNERSSRVFVYALILIT
jgi:hypothetical protein